MKTETTKLIKNTIAVLFVMCLTGGLAYWFQTLDGRYVWAFPVFSVVSGGIWLIVGWYISDTKSLMSALAEATDESRALKTELEGYRADLKKHEKLVDFKQKLFKIFRGPRAKLFRLAETVIAIFRKEGRGKYADRIDDVLAPFGFHKHSLMNIRVASNITLENLREAQKALKQAVPDVQDFYFIRIPHPSYIVPVNFGKRVQHILRLVTGLQYSEDDFDKALLTKEIDIDGWLSRLPITDFLSAYDRDRYPKLQDVFLKQVMKKIQLNLGTLHRATESSLESYLVDKGVSTTDAAEFARTLVQTFKQISNFVRIVEDHTFIPE